MNPVLRKHVRLLLQPVLLACLLCTAAHATVVLTLNPANGALVGQQGDTVGWGFTIFDNNPSGFWVSVSATGFCTSNFNTGTDTLPCQGPSGTTPVAGGTYLDFSPFNFVDSGPNAPDTSQQNFSYNPPCNVGPCTGTGAFTINQNAPNGLLPGVIVVDYQLFSSDPATCGFCQIGGDNFITAPASVFVIPEPSTFLLLGLGLSGLAFARFRHKRR